MIRRRSSWLACFAATLVGSAAFAAPPSAVPSVDAPPTYSLSWVRGEGAESCPAGRVLAGEVERRLGRKVFDASAERSFEVSVARVGDTFKSDVYVRDAAGATVGHRALSGDEPGCGPLLSATALAIALVIDPEAAAQRPATSGAFEPPPAPEPAPPPPTPAPEPTKVEPAAPARVERVLVREPRALITAALRGGVTGGVVPRVSPAVELAFGVRPGKRWGLVASAGYVGSQNAAEGIGSFDVGLTRLSALLTLDAVSARGVRLLLGAGPSLGVLHLAVREPAPVTAPGDYLYFAAELQAELQISVSSGVFLNLALQSAAPLRRQEFLARGQVEPVWQQPAISGGAQVGLGATFP